MKITALRRIAAATVLTGTIAGAALIAGPASAAPTKPSSGASILATQYIQSSTQAACERARKAAVSLHSEIGDLVSYSSKCTYYDWNGTWNAQVVYR